MKVNVWNTILQLSKERDVEPRLIVRAIEDSLRVAASRFFPDREKIQIDFKPEKGELRVFAEKTVSEKPADPAEEISLEEAKKICPDAKPGDKVVIDLPSETLGRIAAQAAKQVILQKVRDAEQQKVYDEFVDRVGEIAAGVYRRQEDDCLILEANKYEISLPLRETLPGEDFRRGDMVKGVVLQVMRAAKGPQVVMSRTSPRFLEKLLEVEIPEIAAGTIEVKAVVRQPGERAKVAVLSHDRAVDPIGACIGVRGNRISAISGELRGEKIDIVNWSADPAVFARAALSPARVEKMVLADKKEKVIEAVVPADQLSLAIGKKGINVKLASRLVGWKITIKQE